MNEPVVIIDKSAIQEYLDEHPELAPEAEQVPYGHADKLIELAAR